jgi:Restriction endonuclease NotI
LKPATHGPVICCPVRLYADDYRILQDVADAVFAPGLPLRAGASARQHARTSNQPCVAVFGKDWGGELRLPQRGGRGGYFVDWILARLDASGVLTDFVAVEVQSIDTTGNYQQARLALLRGDPPVKATAGFNWENVSKRILPQIIYKGHVLRREPLCTKGLFFICPTPVFMRINDRLGGTMMTYGLQPGSMTFRWYDLDPAGVVGVPRPLLLGGQFTTTVDQVALAFTSPSNLPPARVYEQAITEALLS